VAGVQAGQYQNSLIEHWDGKRWQVVNNPGNGVGLFGVAGVSSGDVWAVGSSNDDEGFVEHWDGARWRVVSSPALANIGISGGFNALSDVVVISGRDAWIVGTNGGDTLAEHWDGTRWTIVPSPNGIGVSSLLALVARSAHDVWAVGGSTEWIGDQASEALIEHWDGARWRLVYRTRDAFFSDVTAISANDVWVLGASGFE
jgi:hypothetical protein